MGTSRRFRPATPLFLLAALGQTRAQDPTATPLVRVDALGPAAWRTCFLPTNLGSLLASADGEKVLRPLIEELDQLWRQVDPEEQAAARARILAFGGHVSIGVWPSPERADPTPAALAVAIGGAAEDELRGLAGDLERWLRLLGKDEAHEIAGQAFRVVRDGDMACTTPKLIDDHLLALVADGLPGLDLAARVALPWLRTAAAPPANAPLRITIDLAQGFAHDRGLASQRVFVPLGLASLSQFVVTLGTDGPRVKADFELRFKAGERGLFAGLFPERDGVPALGDLVPKDATGWKVGWLDPAALWRAGLRAAAAERQMTEAEIAQETTVKGVSIGDDLIAHLGDRVLVVWREEPGDEDDAKRLALSLVMPARNEPAVHAALAKLLADTSMQVTDRDGVLRATEAESWLFPALHLVAGHGVVGLALGRRGGEELDAIVARAKDREPAPPPGVDQWRKRAPAGFNSIGSLALDTFLHHQLQWMLEGLGEPGAQFLTLDAKSIAAALQPLLPLVVEHDLARVVTLTGCAEGRWCLRVLW